MKLPRDLSGAELIKVLCRDFGYRKVNQEGSHIILQTDAPRPHRLARPPSAPAGDAQRDSKRRRPRPGRGQARCPRQIVKTKTGRLATRIINEVKGVNRCVFDITSKPLGTIEWE